MTNTSRGPSRRTLVKGAAWSVPVVAVAGAAPAFAASPSQPIDFTRSSACKIPGSSYGGFCYADGYVLWAVFENPASEPLTITITSMTVGGTARCIVGIADITGQCSTEDIGRVITLAPGESREYAIYTNQNGSSNSTALTVGFEYQVGTGPVQSGTQSGDVGGSPWQGSCRHRCSGRNAPMSACGTDCSASSTAAQTDEATAEATQVDEAVDAEGGSQDGGVTESPAPVDQQSAPAEAQAPAAPAEATAPNEDASSSDN